MTSRSLFKARLAGAGALLANARVAQLARAGARLASERLPLGDNARVVVAARAPVPRVTAGCLDVRRDNDHLLSHDQGSRTAPAYPDGRATREICRICWRPSPVGFTVPDRIWQLAVHPEHQEHVLCIGCFTAYADERMVAWDRDIEFWPVSAATMLEEVPAHG